MKTYNTSDRTDKYASMSPRKTRNIPIAMLRAFVAVKQTGGLSQAARELGITQPAVSAQIKRLQQILGDDLFIKTPAGPMLTPTGTLVEANAQRILLLNDQIFAHAGQTSNRDTINLGIQSAFARCVMPLVMRHCGGPQNSVHYVYGSTLEMAEKWKSGYVDLVLMLASTDSWHNMLCGWNEPLVWVSGPDWSMRPGEPIPFVTREGGFMDRKVLHLLSERSIPYVVRATAPDSTAMHAAVASGIGLMVTAERCVPNFLVIRNEYRPALPDLPVGVFHREGFDPSRHKPITKAFVSAVVPPNVKFFKAPKPEFFSALELRRAEA
jgi:DNA-binding transcriptional LysR family regulator